MDTIHKCLYIHTMTLGENVKYLREKRGLTYEAVGVAVGTDGQNIFNLEKRKSQVSKFAPALAQFFGVDLDNLMQGDMSAMPNGKTESSRENEKSLIAAEEAMRLLYLYGKLDAVARSQAMTMLEGLAGDFLIAEAKSADH